MSTLSRETIAADSTHVLHERLAAIEAADEEAARFIRHAFHDMHAAIGECRCSGDWPSTNHKLEYIVAQSTNARARAIHRCIHEVRRGILYRRQERIRIRLELQRREGI